MKNINKEDLDTILEWFNKSDLVSASISYDEKGGYKISLSRSPGGLDGHLAPYPQYHHATQVSAAPVQGAVANASAPAAPQADGKQLQEIKAPIVGTFYRSSSPDAPPFVQVGDKVKKGQTICILEAMKVMNELEAEFDMEIAAVLVENSQLVEYNQPVFQVIPL